MLGKGEGERWGDRACGEEVQARGDGGILLVDFRLPTLVYRWLLSLDPRPCRELGRIWTAGELGELEHGEAFWGRLASERMAMFCDHF